MCVCVRAQPRLDTSAPRERVSTPVPCGHVHVHACACLECCGLRVAHGSGVPVPVSLCHEQMQGSE